MVDAPLLEPALPGLEVVEVTNGQRQVVEADAALVEATSRALFVA